MKETQDMSVVVAQVLRKHLDTTTSVAEVMSWATLCHSMANVFVPQEGYEPSHYKVLRQTFLNACGFADAGFELVS